MGVLRVGVAKKGGKDRVEVERFIWYFLGINWVMLYRSGNEVEHGLFNYVFNFL